MLYAERSRPHLMKRREFLKALPAFVPALRSMAGPAGGDQHVELRSQVMRVTVVAGPGGVRLTRFFLKRAKFDAVFFTTDPWTDDLLRPEGSGSALLPEGWDWQAAYLGPAGHVTS